MIIERYRADTYVRGQRVLFKTNLFNKEYFWMEDIDGTVYLASIDEYGNPEFS